MDTNIKLDPIDSAIEDIKQGKMVIVVDDEDRENEGDLVMAAEKVTPEAINFMTKFGRGLICAPLTTTIAAQLKLGEMVQNNTDSFRTNFTVSVDAWDTTTGISAHERAHTIQTLVSENATESMLRKPGHIFPLIAQDGGVLKRAGHTEASIDLAQLAGLKPAGVICEIMNEDGSMARLKDLVTYKKRHNLKIISIQDLIAYRRQRETLITRSAVTNMPTKSGEFTAYGYENILTGEHHVALVKGNVKEKENVLVRVHSECLTGDVFGSLRCDCGDQLKEAMERVNKQGAGVILYMRQEGRGIGLINKLKAYDLQDQGYDTVEANIKLGFKDDLRDYGIGAQILADLGIKSIDLMTNNPRKIIGLEGYGIKIANRVAIQMNHNERNIEYLKTKKEKLGHMLNIKEKK
jgi:3,4-dihydroxy 2-butanone 4-phosphate synthase/GTP cyclohydrolase II